MYLVNCHRNSYTLKIMAVSSLLFSASACQAQQSAPESLTPPPPPIVYEFFNPIVRDYSINVTCASRKLEINWHFDGKQAEITNFSFKGKAAPPDELLKMKRWAREIDGDLFVWTECNYEEAVVALIQASTREQQIRFHWKNGVATEYRRVGFDGASR